MKPNMTKEEAIEWLLAMAKEESLMDFDDNADKFRAVATMLSNATIWTPCEERMPTSEDGDRDGDVNALDHYGVATVYKWSAVNANNFIAWSRIEPIQGGGNG